MFEAARCENLSSGIGGKLCEIPTADLVVAYVDQIVSRRLQMNRKGVGNTQLNQTLKIRF